MIESFAAHLFWYSILTNYLFWGSGTDTLEKNAAITNVRGICLDDLEGIF